MPGSAATAATDDDDVSVGVVGKCCKYELDVKDINIWFHISSPSSSSSSPTAYFSTPLIAVLL